MQLEENYMQTNTQNLNETQTVKNDCYMVDDQGKEIQITTTMVQDMCIELLKQCRTVKN
ncbi:MULTISPECIES: PA1571 family protein [Acinetobacter]|nr:MULTISPECIES: PA1571 family protein [Acinetobacter]MBF7691158.1 hypothetical protein [Acinetobacter pollinis]MBF7698831.1 hypothetical protein [Acinetobacter pollinis]MBF7699543.1 hypothetical protein [Acinetobacter pollinis]WEV48292.1 hypothetical protein OZX61_08360 [Acinetobacter sp. ESL0695]